MLITRTPMRVSLLGGGSDYPAWFSRHGGLCLGGAINKYSFISARFLPPYHNYKTRVSYSEIECVQKNDEVKHRAIQAVLQILGLDQPDSPGLEISHTSDLPGRSGTGSSSSFVVGLVHALGALQGKLFFPLDLARLAIRVEQEIMKETVGCQDQTFAAVGGLNQIRFEKNGQIYVYPIPLTGEEIVDLEQHLALYYTGINRSASQVSSQYVNRLATDDRYQWAMIHLTENGIDALQRKSWIELGKLLHQAWGLKRQLIGVSNEHIDRIYNTGILAGAVGGKLIGAGGGGCVLFVLPDREVRENLNQTMAGLGLVPIPFCFDHQGSRVIFINRENGYD